MTTKEERPICKGRVQGDYRSYACSSKSWKDGYCKTHNPERIKEKAQARNDKWRRERQEQIDRREEKKLARHTATAEKIIEYFLPAMFSANNTGYEMKTPDGMSTKQEVTEAIIKILDR